MNDTNAVNGAKPKRKKAPDEADRLKAGTLPLDPDEGLEPMPAPVKSKKKGPAKVIRFERREVSEEERRRAQSALVRAVSMFELGMNVGGADGADDLPGLWGWIGRSAAALGIAYRDLWNVVRDARTHVPTAARDRHLEAGHGESGPVAPPGPPPGNTDTAAWARGLASVRQALEAWAGQPLIEAPPRRPSPPPVGGGYAGERKELTKARTAIAELGSGPAVCRWAGWRAERAGAGDELEAVAPNPEAFAAGREDARQERSAPWPTKDQAAMRRAERAIDAIGRDQGRNGGAGEEEVLQGLEVLRVVYHQRPGGLGGVFDVDLSYREKEARILALSGKDLRSYSSVANKAMDYRLALPVAGKGTSERWLELLQGPLDEATVVQVPEAAEPAVAAENELRELVGAAPRGETADDLDRGQALEEEVRPADGLPPSVTRAVLLTPKAVLDHVKRAMPDDGLGRAEVMAAASRIGGVHKRARRLRAGGQRDVILFPAPAKAAPGPGDDS